MVRRRKTTFLAFVCMGFVVVWPITWHRTVSQSSALEKKSNDKWIIEPSTLKTATSTENKIEDRHSAVSDYRDTAEKFQHRINNLKSQCLKESSSKKEWSANKNFLIHYNRRLLVCAVPKAGSTSWHRLLWALRRQEAGLSTNDSLYTPQDTVRNHATSMKLTLEQGTEMITFHEGDDDMLQEPPSHEVKRILLARHPFARLISGWNQKFLPGQAYADLMMKRYGVLKVYKGRHHDPRHQIAWEDFAEFIANYGTSISHLDYHFMPVWWLCKPCEYPYSYIVKSETIDQDQNWLMRRLDLGERGLGRHGVPPGGSLVNNNPSGKIKDYMSRLSDQTRRKLYKIYEKDFRLLGYTFDFNTLESGGFD